MIKLKNYLQKLMHKNSIFVSIGANDGIFVDEIFQSNLLDISWKSYFVEPVKETFDKLVSNYNNHYPGNSFIFINNAINTYSGNGILITNKIDDSRGMCSFFRQESEQTTKIPVSCITFAELLNRYGISDIDFLKIDTEGMDYEIVAQCINNSIFPKIILLEHISLNAYAVTTYEQMLDIIKPYYTIIEDTPEYQYEEANILLVNNNYV